ncbi:MAG: tetratricopeptide repeat protein [Anaerolineae bacterium]|nr:tetratricopeptide repeat protein [Anaerolineae bacterium]
MMADISLRDYLAKLDNLLDKGANSEVVHHCRHILQYYPKNAETYRRMGKALVYGNNFNEAGEVLRRVLSIYPDDYTAHAGLSEVYLAEKRLDDAIWHLERAFEQEPNNEAVLDTLRELYRRHRKTEYSKIQLTAGAVARQYIRNGLYEQAIETLNAALERSPERIDLQLLLAQTYRSAGYRLESGETAFKVLQTLPECLEANLILAELWLEEERPTDAQRFINRVQSVDPYLALGMAEGRAMPDDAFRLEELDYRKVAEREIISRTPDWLGDINQSADVENVATDEDWMSALANRSAVIAQEEALGDDWFSDVVDAADEAPVESPLPLPQTPRRGLTGRLTPLEPVTPPDAVQDADEFDDLFGDMSDSSAPEVPAAAVDLDDLFAAAPDAASRASAVSDAADLFSSDEDLPAAEAAVPTRQTGALKEVDPLAWLKESGIEVVETPQADNNLDWFDAEDDNLVLQDVDAVDPLAWLQGYGGQDMIVEDADSGRPLRRAVFEEDAPPANTGDDDDPLAWLNDSRPQSAPLPPTPQQAKPAASTADPLDWLSDESLLDEALSLEALVDDRGAPPERPSETTVPASLSDRQDTMANDRDDDLSWLNASDAEPVGQGASGEASAGDELIWFDDLPETDEVKQDAPAQPVDDLDWMSSEIESGAATAGDIPDWLAEMQPPGAQPSTDAPADTAWMDLSEQEESLELIEDDVPDWLSQMAPEQPAAQAATSDDFAWEEEPEAEALPAEDVPDWLSQMAPEQPAAQAATGDDFAWEEEPEAEALPAEDVPDWLSQMAPEQPAAQAATGDDFAWEEEPEAEALPAEDVPDWLSQMAPEQPAEPQQIRQAFTWEAEAEATAETDSPLPDWMTEMELEQPEAPAAQTEPAAEFEWLEVDGAAAAPVSAMLVDEVPALIADDLPIPDPEDADDSILGAFDDGSLREDALIQAEALSADLVPDWLAGLPSAQADEEEFVLAADPETADWLTPTSTDIEPIAVDERFAFDWSDEQEQPVLQGDAMPDWLSEMQPESEESPDAAPVSVMPDWMAASDDIDTLDEASSEHDDYAWHGDEEAVAMLDEDAPDWLNEVRPTEQAPFEAEPASSEYGWIDDINAEEAAPEFAEMTLEGTDVDETNTPDWLNAMVPGLDVDFDAPEDEQIESEFLPGTENRVVAAVLPETPRNRGKRDFDWLVDIVDTESRPMSAVVEGIQRRFKFTRLPAWLRQPLEERSRPMAEQKSDNEMDDIDLPPWLQ